MRYQATTKSDVGKKRSLNEDFTLVAPELGLYLVCDGMGGHAAGEVASATAARTVKEHIARHTELLSRFDDTTAGRTQLVRLVEEAIQLASERVYGLATSDAGKAGMGTTLTMLLVAKTVAVMGHVGDTRLYLQRGGRLHQLSEDHTYVAEMARRGSGKIEELKKGPFANVVTRAVGIQETVQADTLVFDLMPSDTLLLCSDGLTRHLESDHELSRFLENDHLDSISGLLVDLANTRGGLDNISAIVVRTDSDDVDNYADKTRTTELNLRMDVLKEIVLFHDLELSELCRVMSFVQTETTDAGDVVVKEGADGDALYMILDGEFSVTRAGQEIRRLSKGAHFGEMALFNKSARSATVRALGPGRLLVIHRERFEELVNSEPKLGVRLLWTSAQTLSTRLDETIEQLFRA